MKHYNFQPTAGTDERTVTSNYRQTALQKRIRKTNLRTRYRYQ
jgi:hypothetical protein